MNNRLAASKGCVPLTQFGFETSGWPEVHEHRGHVFPFKIDAKSHIRFWVAFVLKYHADLRPTWAREKLILEVRELSKTEFKSESITRMARSIQNPRYCKVTGNEIYSGHFRPLMDDGRFEAAEAERQYWAEER